MNNIFKILKKELMEIFRDKKSLSKMLIIPLLIPAIIIGMSALFESEVDKPIDDYNKIGFNYKLSDVEKELANKMNIRVYQINSNEIKKEYDNGNIDLYIIKKDNNYIINGEDNEVTNYASNLMKEYYNNYKEFLQRKYLENNNISSSEIINIISVQENITTKNNFFASYIINYAFLFVIMAITVSSTYPATDATAGEKERGTLETLLTFPIKSKDIIIGKFLSVSFSSIVTGLFCLLLMECSLYYVGSAYDIFDGANLVLSYKSLIFSIFVIVMYSFLISGLCISISSKSKTFKEAQSALTPLMFISFFPGMIAFMIDIEMTNITAIVPFLNYTLLFREIVDGNFNIIHIILMTVSTFIFIILLLNLIIKQYKSEKVLFSE